MNYILILLIVLPVFMLIIWIDSSNKKNNEKFKDLKRLIYKVHDEVSAIKRVNKDNHHK